MAQAVLKRAPTATEALERELLTPEAVRFLAELHDEFDETRKALLRLRGERRRVLSNGMLPDRLPSTQEIRKAEWRVADSPPDLQKRHVEITGPTDRKMMINALNSGADCFMADLEDALSPTWQNVLEGHANLADAVRRRLRFEDPERGRSYELGAKTATLLVRPRGWHLVEAHQRIRAEEISASLFDFGLHMFHNGRELIERGSGPYFYLPKLESHLEARLWSQVFAFAEERLGLEPGTIRATVLIETFGAAFEMEEILFELRNYVSGLNAGRWDYIFSVIKAFSGRRDYILPDRDQITMTVPFMQAYTDHLVSVCHRRGAHAIGGMAAFIPTRADEEINRRAFEKVREDKQREARQGFDGTWVAHPGLVDVAREEFRKLLGERPHQKEKLPERPEVSSQELRDISVPGGNVTEAGVRTNIRVALQYLNEWLTGRGAVAIDGLMEDAATAEISRAQLWQWVNNAVALDDGNALTLDHYCRLKEQEMARLEGRRLEEAGELLDELVEAFSFPEFLTPRAYERLEA